MVEICHLHALLLDNKPELTQEKKDEDPLAIILNDIGKLRRCPENNSTEVQLTLINRFPPVLTVIDRKKNLKTDTINEAIKYALFSFFLVCLILSFFTSFLVFWIGPNGLGC
jgi:hypothetical protein